MLSSQDAIDIDAFLGARKKALDLENLRLNNNNNSATYSINTKSAPPAIVSNKL